MELAAGADPDGGLLGLQLPLIEFTYPPWRCVKRKAMLILIMQLGVVELSETNAGQNGLQDKALVHKAASSLIALCSIQLKLQMPHLGVAPSFRAYVTHAPYLLIQSTGA